MKKSQVIETVQSSVSSIYSREDVIKIINMIEDERKISTLQIAQAIDKAIDELERQGEGLFDLPSAEFTMGYDNRIELENVSLDFDYLREALENSFMDLGEVVEESEMSSECGACGGHASNCDGC